MATVRVWRPMRSSQTDGASASSLPIRENISCLGVQDHVCARPVSESDWAERRAAGDEVVQSKSSFGIATPPEERARRARHITHQVHAEGGTTSRASTSCRIRYHALLAHLPISSVQLVDHDYTQLIKSDDVMFFRPAGSDRRLLPFGVWSDLSDLLSHIPPLPNQQHRLRAALRRLPLANHVVGGSARHRRP